MAISVNPGPPDIWIDGTPVSKAQVRALLADIISDANGTFDTIIGDLNDGRGYYVSAALSPSGATVPVGAKFVIAGHNGSGTISDWRPVAAPEDGIETDIIVKDAGGNWWLRMVSADAESAKVETRDGREFVVWAAESPSGANIPVAYAADTVTSVHLGTGLRRRWRRLGGPPVDGLETDEVKKDANDTWWQLTIDAGVFDEATQRIADVQDLQWQVDGKASVTQVTILTEPAPRVDGSLAIITAGKNDGTDDLMRLHPNGFEFERHGGEPGGLTADGWAVADGSFTAQAGQHGVLAVDRFLDRPDGVRVPVPVVNGETRKAIIVSLYGQSNADVTQLSDALIWGTPPFPYNAFMLDDMNAGGNLRGGMMGWQGVAVARGSRMINASEAARLTQSYGSAALSRLLMWDGRLRRVGLVRSSAWGGNKIVGDAAGQGIWQDSTGAYTQSWINWTGDIQQSYDLLTAEGYEVEAIYVCFNHQEADWQTPAATYETQFAAMKAERAAIMASAFPGVATHWFVDQASGSGRRTPTYNGGAWPVRSAIADIADSDPDVTMVMPRYWMPFGRTLADVQEDIHHAYRARVWQGEVFAAAIREFEAGRAWSCPRMSAASIIGNDVVVEFNSLNPLVIDPSFCKVRPDMGFSVNGGAIAVTDVRLTGQRQVTVTCSAPPTGTIAYAYRSVDAQDVLDEWPISTGAIRDSWSMPSLFDPGKDLPRAALGGILNL